MSGEQRLSTVTSDHATSSTNLDRRAVPIGQIQYRCGVSHSRWHGGNQSSATASADAGGGGPGVNYHTAIGKGPQQVATTVSEDLVQMYEESTLCDIEVLCTVGRVQRFCAHRMVLAARSAVFKAMFRTDMREKRAGLVILEDVSSDAVKCMLDFAYKDACPHLDEACVLDTLQLANKYNIVGLQDICLDFMARHCRSDNIVPYIVACERYQLLEFRHSLLEALVDNPPALHECIHGHDLEDHPDLMKQLLTMCAHQLSRVTQKRNVVKHFDGLPYRSHCYLCVREVEHMSKQMLGEMLFPMVIKIQPEHASKITGMIIELPNLELVPLFESESALRAKVEEALRVLSEADKGNEP